jgi:hypothetical protein
MKISDKVLRYIEEEMTPSEKEGFEKELANSQELKNEIAEYHRLMNHIKEAKKVSIDERYFTTIIPRFRLKQPTAKKRLYPVYAAVSMAAVIIAIFILYPGKNGNIKSTIPQVTAVLDSSAIESPEQIAGDYNNIDDNTDTTIIENDEYNAAIKKMLLDELKVSEESLDSIYYSSYATYSQSISDLSDEESQVIYDEIINKRLF